MPKLSGTVLALGTIMYKIIVGNVPDKLKERKKFKTAQSLEVLIIGIILKREVEYSFNYIWLNRKFKILLLVKTNTLINIFLRLDTDSIFTISKV